MDERSGVQMISDAKKTISISDTLPIAVLGLQHLLAGTADLAFGSVYSKPTEWMLSSGPRHTDILIIDNAFGAESVRAVLAQPPPDKESVLRPVAKVVWGLSMTEGEALLLFQAGANGVMSKSAPSCTVLACLRAILQGHSWMHDAVCTETETHTNLSPREHQILRLVEQGYKNREIAEELGIVTGTVKVHLQHIFAKTKAIGRYNLALKGLRRRGFMPFGQDELSRCGESSPTKSSHCR